MEKQNNQICTGLLRNCSMALQADKKIAKKEIKLNDKHIITSKKNSEQPWSVFGEHYWI